MYNITQTQTTILFHEAVQNQILQPQGLVVHPKLLTLYTAERSISVQLVMGQDFVAEGHTFTTM